MVGITITDNDVQRLDQGHDDITYISPISDLSLSSFSSWQSRVQL